MPQPFDRQSDRVYVLSKAFCRDGTVSGSRKQRLACALVELRDHIEEEFKTVSKAWQVAAEDLRGCYSYVYPASAPGAPDPLILERACEELMRYVRQEIQSGARQFGVPDNLLEEVLVDWLVADAMEVPRTPTAFFVPESMVVDPATGWDDGNTDAVPSAMRLLAARRGAKGDLAKPVRPAGSSDGRPYRPQIAEAADGD